MDDSSISELKNELSTLKNLMQEIKIKVDNIETLERSEIRDILLISSMESKELSHLDNIKDLENEELTHLDTLKELEGEELKKLHKMTPKKFNDVTSWKHMIWDGCDQKIMNDSKRIVSFMCKLTKKICSYEFCPKNKVQDSGNDNNTKT